LFNNMVRFTQPSELNDPFESAFLIKGQSEREAFVAPMRDILRSMLIARGDDPDGAGMSEFMDSVMGRVEKRTEALFSPQMLGKNLADLVNRSQGVFSMSRVNDNLLMWSHYASSHAGFVLGLDETHEFFHHDNVRGKPTCPQNVVYSSLRNAAQVVDFERELLYRKSIDWAYEEEVRLVKDFEIDIPKIRGYPLDKVHLYCLPSECIKEVYIGANMTKPNRDDVLELISSRKIKAKVYDAYISSEKYELRFRICADRHINYRAEEACRHVSINGADMRRRNMWRDPAGSPLDANGMALFGDIALRALLELTPK
jgi:hypothetical protein